MKFGALESWRGICALLVVLFHLGAAGHFYSFPLVRNGHFGVEFFFVLSGFVMSHAYGHRLGDIASAGRFLVRRFGRLYPLHLVTLAGMVLLELAKLFISVRFGVQGGEAPFSGANSLPALAGNLALVNGLGFFDKFTWNGPSWSISTEFCAYLVFMLLCLLGGGWRRIGAGVLMVAAAVAYVVLNPHTIQGGGLLLCLAGFFLGTLVQLVHQTLVARTLAPPSWMEWPVLAAVLWVFIQRPEVNALVALLIFAPAVLVFAFERGPVSRVLLTPVPAFLGLISYSLYLVHFPIISAMGGAARAVEALFDIPLYGPGPGGETMLTYGGPWAMDLLMVAFVAVVIGVASLTYRFVEDPGRNLFNRLSDRGSRSTAADAVRP